jgi:uncharacterized RDD family membrane protein YckC
VTHGAAAGSESPRVFASLRARFVAGLIDLAVITVLSVVVSSLFANVPGNAADAVVTAFVSVYFILSYSAAGRGYSIGKRALGIRVVSRLGEPLTLAKATVRWFISIGIALPLAVLVIGFERGSPVRTGPAFAIAVPILCVVIVDSYMCATNEDGHRSLHDIAAGSYVVRRGHVGEVPATAPLARGHYIWMALCCLAVAFWFSWMYPLSRAIGEREVELMKARAVAIAAGKAGTLIIAPAFTTEGSDTAWVVSAIASILASPRTEHEAEALRKSLACLLAREAPAAFRGAELDLLATFDAGAKSTQPTAVYIADLELTPRACNGP